MVELLGKMLEREIECEYAPNPLQGYVYETLADTSKAEEILGFKPKYTLEQGIVEIIEYYK